MATRRLYHPHFQRKNSLTPVDKKIWQSVFDKLFLSVSWWGAARYCCTIHLYIIDIPFLSVSRSAESYVYVERFGLGLRSSRKDSLSSFSQASCLKTRRENSQNIFLSKFCGKTNKGDLKIESRVRRRGLVGRWVHTHFVFCMGVERRHTQKGKDDAPRERKGTLRHCCSSNSPFMYKKTETELVRTEQTSSLDGKSYTWLRFVKEKEEFTKSLLPTNAPWLKSRGYSQLSWQGEIIAHFSGNY